MAFGITVLGGGSRGNSLLVHTSDSGLLIDAGFSRKEILRRLVKSNIDPALVSLILVTHEHQDHVKGCRILSDHLKIPVCASYKTFEYLRSERDEKWENTRIFSPGSTFDFDAFTISPFSVQHDSIDPVGFVIEHQNFKVGVATDLGCVNELVKRRLTDCDALILESNYDMDMLRAAPRSLSLKRRIMGRHGHLDNREAIEALPELLTTRTKALFLTHISSECNDGNLVRKLAEDKLHDLGRADIVLNIVEQDEPSGTVWM